MCLQLQYFYNVNRARVAVVYYNKELLKELHHILQDFVCESYL